MACNKSASVMQRISAACANGPQARWPLSLLFLFGKLALVDVGLQVSQG
jgi:hypothetical protein